MRIVDEFIQPILQDALSKFKAEKDAGKSAQPKDKEIEDDETLLDHLVRYTNGKCSCIGYVSAIKFD